MMKFFTLFYAVLNASIIFGQIEQISTGCTQGIGYSMETDSAKYFIAADQAIVRYSKTTGNIDLLPVPHYSGGLNSGFQILNDSVFYVSTIYPGYPYPFTLSKSITRGQNWGILLDTICDKDLANILVIDTNKIYLLGSAQLSLKTTNGGDSWTETGEVSNSRKYFRYNDTIEFHAAGNGFNFTLNSGETWNYADDGVDILNCMSRSLHPKALDSIYLISLDNGCSTFAYCFSEDYSAQNWQIIYGGVLWANDVYAMSVNEIYLVGHDGYQNHRIAKTTDLGTSWQIFDPGIDGEINSITPLNDSVFLVSGKYGSLYKWNKNQTQWGSLGLEEISKQGISIFPNPSGGVFRLESETAFEVLAVTDFTGRNVNYSFDETTGILNIDEPAGMYFVQFGYQNGWITQKLVVE